MRIRHYGFLANRCRKEKLAKILAYPNQPAEEPPADEEEEMRLSYLHVVRYKDT